LTNTGLGGTRIFRPFMPSGVRIARLLFVKWRMPLSAWVITAGVA
jgi:hypothetical protein